MDPRLTGGLPTLLESTLLTMRPANEERMRHDLTTLAARLPDEVDDPIAQLAMLGERVGADFTTSAIGEAELETIAERLRSVPLLKPRGPLAIVADGNRGELGRLFMSLTSDERPVQVFRSIHEARKWLLANSGTAF